jgi:hypothetical protein
MSETVAVRVDRLVADHQRGRLTYREFLAGLGYSEDEIRLLVNARLGGGMATLPSGLGGT